MTLDKRTRAEMLAHCGEIHEDDGVDPRTFFKVDRNEKRQIRKTMQLCRQVAETLDQVLSAETGDDVLSQLRVVDARPAPDTSRLLITLQVDCPDSELDWALIQRRLAHAQGHLRCEVAAAITRRKTPVLVFNVVGPTPLPERTREDRR